MFYLDGYILLCPNAHRDINLAATAEAAELLRSHGHEVRIAPFLSEGLEADWPEDIQTEKLEDALPGARLVISFGGDGTILQASRYLPQSGTPILGVNMGHKGFLAELERNELSRLVSVADGSYTIQNRMMLDISLIRDGKVVYSSTALNEAVVRSTDSIIRVEVCGDGREITEFSGDGLIVSTPTGSTAYSMAAGGPLVEPDSECIIITPICPFRLAARSIVLTPERVVTVRTLEQGDKQVLLTLDGVSVPFLTGDELRVSRSAHALLMAHISGRSFYDIVYEKLNDKDTGGERKA